ncbi:MAG: hypothetical protein DSM107014_02520 [Gomphosphaeria aponina SAG 52.96 = DSM 107014]|uniref:VWFA domain-containing protein n=1 Tax=Gomphosphaeria aponina SAG 52.96 = DSM 107014 TaxID=1521640 RepID=A0A941GPQ8_9CHRO|nr:hypothetical protein [Gomphosphaeria aponina SAG 52.96 = DSM 107014]
MVILHQKEVGVFNVPVPWLLSIVIDCTASISVRDFQIAQQEIKHFLINVHKRAYQLSGLPADFVSLTAFKDKNHIFGPSSPLNVVKMDKPEYVAALCQWIDRLQRDGGATVLG